LTEANLPSQSGKVFLVTEGYSGVGFDLCKILYLAGGKVYLAGRSEEKARAAMHRITSETVSLSSDDIIFLPLPLDDLTTIKPAVEKFFLRQKIDSIFYSTMQEFLIRRTVLSLLKAMSYNLLQIVWGLTY
jgi:NAD(P)-dependent dehydrogenase (short-subunit alcohol dehydrogenase family)